MILTSQQSKNLSHLKEYWAYYNSQLISQTQYFCKLKMRRMNQQIGEYARNFNETYKRLSGVFNDLNDTIVKNAKKE